MGQSIIHTILTKHGMGFNDKHRTGCKSRKFHEAILQMGQYIIHTIRNFALKYSYNELIIIEIFLHLQV